MGEWLGILLAVFVLGPMCLFVVGGFIWLGLVTWLDLIDWLLPGRKAWRIQAVWDLDDVTIQNMWGPKPDGR